MMPTTGSGTGSRKRTATFTTARSPVRHTIVGLPLSPIVSTRRISARPSPRRTVGAIGGVMLSPHARGEAQQTAFAGAVLANDADHGSVRRDYVEIDQGRARDVAKCKRHKR